MKRFMSKTKAGALLLVICLLCSVVQPVSAAAVQRAEWADTSVEEQSTIEVPYTPTASPAAYGENIEMDGVMPVIRPVKVKDGILYLNAYYMDENFQRTDTCTMTLHITDACDESDQIASWSGKGGAVSGVKNLKNGTYYLKIEFPQKLHKIYTFLFYVQTVPEVPQGQVQTKLRTGYYLYNKSGKDISYKVTLKKSGLLYVDASYDELKGGEFIGGKITLYDEKNKKIPYSTAQLNGEVLEEYALEAGTYYVKMQGAGSGVYYFRTEFDTFSVENNKSRKTASELSTPKTVDTLLTLSGKKDGARWYKFKLKKTSYNRIILQNYSEENSIKYALYLNNKVIQSGTLKPYTYKSGDGSRTSLTGQLSDQRWKKGTYYLRIYKPSKSTQALVTVKRVAYIQNMSVKKIAARVWNKKAQSPSVVVKNGSRVLKEGTDYQLSYRNNKNVGTATVKITGIGKYRGSKTVTFRILPVGTKITKTAAAKNGTAVSWKKKSAASGYQIRYAQNAKMKNAGVVSVNDADTGKVVLEKLQKGKKYYLQIRTYQYADGKRICSKWSEQYKVKAK